MRDRYDSVYLDSCIYVDVILGQEPFVAVARPLLAMGVAKQYQVVASPLVYAEVAGISDIRAPSPEEAERVRKQLDEFFEQRFCRWVETDLLVARRARDLSRSYGLKGPDAVHLASAMRAGADAFMTRDKDFPLGQTVDGVYVCEPHLWGQGSLDDVAHDLPADRR